MRASDRRALGRSGVEVSLLGFGGTAIGNLFAAQTDETARATMDAAWDQGVRYFDTAPLYGLGLSEQRMGAALADRPREEFVISTKVGRVLDPGDGAAAARASMFYLDTPNVKPRFDYTHDGIMRSFGESLGRLGMDRIDVLLLHDLAPHNQGSVEAYEAQYEVFFGKGGYEAMTALRDQGAVKAIGVGVGDWRAAQRLVEQGDFNAVLLAGRYTLLEQDALASFLPLCEARGVGVVIGGPYNSGILATGAVEGARYNYRPAPPEVMEKVARIEKVCAAHKVSLTAAALQFPLHHPAVSSTIPGAGTPQEVATAAHTLAEPVPSSLYEALIAEGLLNPDAPT